MRTECAVEPGGVDLRALVLSKISSKIAKFHLQIVENRLKFQSKSYLALGDVVGKHDDDALEEDQQHLLLLPLLRGSTSPDSIQTNAVPHAQARQAVLRTTMS